MCKWCFCLSNCSCGTRRSHPDIVNLVLPPFHMSVHHFGHSFTFDALKISNDLSDDTRNASSIESFRNKLKTYLLTKIYLLQLFCHHCDFFGMTWSLGLHLFTFFILTWALESVRWRLRENKVRIRLHEALLFPIYVYVMTQV